MGQSTDVGAEISAFGESLGRHLIAEVVLRLCSGERQKRENLYGASLDIYSLCSKF